LRALIVRVTASPTVAVPEERVDESETSAVSGDANAGRATTDEGFGVSGPVAPLPSSPYESAPQHRSVAVRPQDAKRAQDALVAAGMRAEDPPESWLLKVWDGDVLIDLIDLIHQPAGLTVDDELMVTAECAKRRRDGLQVMAIEDVLFTKLNALNEHYLDNSSLLQIARAVREQVDWDRLRERTTGSPYATAFFCLLDELEIVPSATAAR
jgi:hypothetical protein